MSNVSSRLAVVFDLIPYRRNARGETGAVRLGDRRAGSLVRAGRLDPLQSSPIGHSSGSFCRLEGE